MLFSLLIFDPDKMERDGFFERNFRGLETEFDDILVGKVLISDFQHCQLIINFKLRLW